VSSLVISRLDYGNALLYGTNNKIISKLPKGSVRFIRRYQFLKIARSLAMLCFVHIYKKFVLATVMNGQSV
jgi:hypothetical protein